MDHKSTQIHVRHWRFTSKREHITLSLGMALTEWHYDTQEQDPANSVTSQGDT